MGFRNEKGDLVIEESDWPMFHAIALKHVGPPPERQEATKPQGCGTSTRKKKPVGA